MISELPSGEEISRSLERLGMTGAAARRKSELFQLTSNALADPPQVFWFVPGRIELLGKHTDYAGGRSLLCAIDRGLCLAASPRQDSIVRVSDVVVGEEREFPLSRELSPDPGHWSKYPMTVARRVASNFGGPLLGLDLAIGGDLPHAAGMSSSSAMIVGTFLAIAWRNDLETRAPYRENIRSIEDLCQYLGVVENGQDFGSLAGDVGVGTFGGSQDHTAILCSKAGHVVQYGFVPVVREAEIALPEDCTLVVASSGVVAEKTSAAMERYNRASLAVSAILDIWRERTGQRSKSLALALRAAPNAAGELRDALSRSNRADFSAPQLVARLDQFLAESEFIIPNAARALRSGDLDSFGKLVDASQAAAQSGLDNQIPETIYLAEHARQLGAVAASAFGAGFGGSVWAMVRSERAETFCRQWASDYQARFDRPKAQFFITTAGPAAMQIPLM